MPRLNCFQWWSFLHQELRAAFSALLCFTLCYCFIKNIFKTNSTEEKIKI